jgi:hypothetical protein
MATYPYSFTDPSSGDDLATADHAGQHSYLNDVIEDLEAVTGVDGSVDTDSADYIVNHVEPGSIANNSIDLVELAAAVRELTVPAGTIKGYIGSSAPTGWVLMQGQTIANGQTLYPSLYAACPSLFSGSDLVVPDSDPGYMVYSSAGYPDAYTRAGTFTAEHSWYNGDGVPAHNHAASANHSHTESAQHGHSISHGHLHTHVSGGNSTAKYVQYRYYPFTRAANIYDSNFTNYALNTTNNFNGTVYWGNYYNVYSYDKTLGNVANSSVDLRGTASGQYPVVPPSVVVNYIMKVH